MKEISFMLFLLFSTVSYAKKHCTDHFCVELPEETEITDRAWLIKPLNVTLVAGYKDGKLRLEAKSLCDTYEQKLSDKIIHCSPFKPYSYKQGVQFITWKGPGYTGYIRFIIPLNGGFTSVVGAGKFENKKEVNKAFWSVVKIVKTIQLK